MNNATPISSSSLLGNLNFHSSNHLKQLEIIRKKAWIEYFESKNGSPVCFSDVTICAFSTIIERNDLLYSQTEIEFDLSKQFLDKFFTAGKCFVLEDEKAAAKFLALGILFGKYPGMFRTSPVKLIQQLPEQLGEREFVQLFEAMLIRYEVPHFVLRNFEYLNTHEAELLMMSLKGKNLRNNSSFPFKLTRHEAASMLLINSELFKYQNFLFLRAAILKRLSRVTENHELLFLFTNASRKFLSEPYKYAVDIDFWSRAFYLLNCNVNFEHELNHTDCVDYLEYMKYQQVGFSLKGRTSRSLLRNIAEWHLMIHQQKQGIYLNEYWDKSEEPDLSFQFGKRTFRCIELNSGRMLHEEGLHMHHCVVTYTPDCMEGNCRIWSLQEFVRDQYQRLLTLEVWGSKIVQARAKFNDLPDHSTLPILKNWAERMNYTVKLYKNN